MRLPYYHIDAFARAPFAGNPAGVCLLSAWLPDETLTRIAFENNLSETAFVLPSQDSFELRWFTPVREVSLCGHATLAAAHVIFEHLGHPAPVIRFQSKSGVLQVERRGDMLVLDLPARPSQPCPPPEELLSGLGREPLEVWRARSYMAIYPTPQDILAIKPDMQRLLQLDSSGVIVTAPGADDSPAFQGADFVSRFFAPKLGIPEDPVTGSAHCTLIPYWARKLDKVHMRALQLSARGGELLCEHAGERVKIGCRAVTYLRGEIEL